jgi:hypothetical protein
MQKKFILSVFGLSISLLTFIKLIIILIMFIIFLVMLKIDYDFMNKKINNNNNYLSVGLITPNVKILFLTIGVALGGTLNLYSNYLVVRDEYKNQQEEQEKENLFKNTIKEMEKRQVEMENLKNEEVTKLTAKALESVHYMSKINSLHKDKNNNQSKIIDLQSRLNNGKLTTNEIEELRSEIKTYSSYVNLNNHQINELDKILNKSISF